MGVAGGAVGFGNWIFDPHEVAQETRKSVGTCRAILARVGELGVGETPEDGAPTQSEGLGATVGQWPDGIRGRVSQGCYRRSASPDRAEPPTSRVSSPIAAPAASEDSMSP